MSTPITRPVAPTCRAARKQAEVGAWASFYEGARILEMSVCNRLHSVARRLEAADADRATGVEKPTKREIVVALDGAYVRSVPGYQVGDFEAITGKVTVRGRPARRFALVSGAPRSMKMGTTPSPWRYDAACGSARVVAGPWCITFEFEDGDACRVEFEQYH